MERLQEHAGEAKYDRVEEDLCGIVGIVRGGRDEKGYEGGVDVAHQNHVGCGHKEEEGGKDHLVVGGRAWKEATKYGGERY